MYNLKSVQLKNFQIHSDLTVDFTDGVNVISGLTGVGKSCIYKALVWVYGFSDISENDYRKEGTKETSVIIKLSSGFEVERIRSNSLNRYIFRNDKEEKIFDKVGKNPPEEIQKVLGIEEIEFEKINLNINFASQDDLNFIFDSKIPASFNAKLFNKLTGNSILDDLFVNLNRENLSFSKEIKGLDEQIIQQEKEVETCMKQHEELSSKFHKVTELYSQIEEKIIIYEELKKLASKLKENKEAQDFVKFKLDKIVIISDKTINELKSKAELLKELLTLKDKLTNVREALQQTKVKQKLIKIPEIDFDLIKEKVTMYDELNNLKEKLDSNKENKEKITLQLKENKDLYGKLTKELKEIWNHLDFCSKCKPTVERIIFGEKK